jgi:hypothetical protein
MEFATQDDGVLLYRGNFNDMKCFDLIQEAGITWLRLNVYSSWIARSGYTDLDRVVDEARKRGIHVQMSLVGQPRWDADAGHPDGGVSHIDPSPINYAIFVDQVVKHFQGRVHRYSVWNEPNYPAFLGSAKGRNTADMYAELYKAGYGTIKKIDPKIQVLWGEIAGGQGSFTWVKRALQIGGVKADGFAVHPYQYQIAPSQKKPGDFLQFGHMGELKTWLNSTHLIQTPGGNPVGIYITEFGWFVDGQPRSITEKLRAEWCAESIKIAERLGIKQYLYYTMMHSPPSASWNTGIVQTDGTRDSTYLALKKEVTGK